MKLFTSKTIYFLKNILDTLWS
ncbi:unnamed protein product [Acanthoscelides obtectus]|uniref:Uncharacterized protein n=1 Tax=Acanthoscelides obtectus TaxID=200917 RepID=A0A9P0KP97_ACAOB|nr:unnamed protein product [Acanthoscelides obtectus]CAK1620953.1 hypothetical protein AOBTE_LOCUS671 [Acanthoscelides obtectus]